MTKEEAISYLQQLYPNGGHCWLDEQRMEAISMAVKALQEEPVSEDLQKASEEWLAKQLDKSYAKYGERKMMELSHFDGYSMLDAIEFGVQWQKEHLWKLADGDDLPDIDREVIVLYQPYPCEGNEYAVSFAHRPNPDGWDGKNLLTDEIEHYTPETYDRGGWNIPNVMFWLDCELPKKIIKLWNLKYLRNILLVDKT